jgi:D-alanyl-lipoteichoic acid acyltransferase DltB (MBOAT superfamily)
MYFKPTYILIIFFTIVIDYFAGILIERSTGKTRKTLLLISIFANLGILAFYKYFNFIAQNLNFISATFKGPQLPFIDFILPLGLSFHTFQAMSYTIEVYRNNQRAEKHLGIYALYVLFYPQMVAGPIERPQHILPQLHRSSNFNKDHFVTGMFLMMTGLFKKVVIADRLGLFVDPVFSNPHVHTSLDLLLATYFFAFQIYCDFSGYSDIAIGAALTLGVELMQNFNMPYLSKNVSEFWKKWHISLSTWFRDYLYIPLGGNRVTFMLTCINILIVFAISGLWHGANWKYLVWGLLHGFLLVIYQVLKKLKIRINGFAFMKWLITFNLICMAWVFFRANSVQDAIYILEQILSLNKFYYSSGNIMAASEIYYCAVIIILLMLGEWYLKRLPKLSNANKLFVTSVLFVISYLFGVFNEAQFIYFQF